MTWIYMKITVISLKSPETSFLEVWSLGFGGTEYEEIAYKSLIMQSYTIFSWNDMNLH